MEDNQEMSVIEVIIKMVIGAYCLLMLGHALLGIDASFSQELAKEYGVPIGQFSGEHNEMCFFPIPHTEYYAVTDMGKKYLLATQYFGFFSFEDKNIKKFCHPEIYKGYHDFLEQYD